MLLNKLFQIDNLSIQDELIIAQIQVNTYHEILKAHFPGQPVVPGVAMIQLLKELLEQVFVQKMLLESASVIKFLTLFAPPHFTKASFEIKYRLEQSNQIMVNADLKFEDQYFLKFKGIFIKQLK